ncbi:MAG: hypothetical protein ACK6A7_02440 [Planctomycetota bacterium]
MRSTEFRLIRVKTSSSKQGKVISMCRVFALQFTVIFCVVALPEFVLSQDRDFGRRQVEQMLADRPDMRDVIGPEHPIYQWVVDGYQGKHIGQRVFWNANSPRTGRHAEHALPYGSHPAYISISGGAETTAVDKWSAVVFELFNLQNHEKFTQLAVEAASGRLSPDEYATRSVMLEYDATLRTHRLFAANPLPDSTHGRDPWYNAWVKATLPTEEEFKAQHAVAGSTRSNFDYFKTAYMAQIAPHIKKNDEPSHATEPAVGSVLKSTQPAPAR